MTCKANSAVAELLGHTIDKFPPSEKLTVHQVLQFYHLVQFKPKATHQNSTYITISAIQQHYFTHFPSLPLKSKSLIRIEITKILKNFASITNNILSNTPKQQLRRKQYRDEIRAVFPVFDAKSAPSDLLTQHQVRCKTREVPVRVSAQPKSPPPDQFDENYIGMKRKAKDDAEALIFETSRKLMRPIQNERLDIEAEKAEQKVAKSDPDFIPPSHLLDNSSNIATLNLLTPLVLSLADRIRLSPRYLMLLLSAVAVSALDATMDDVVLSTGTIRNRLKKNRLDALELSKSYNPAGPIGILFDAKEETELVGKRDYVKVERLVVAAVSEDGAKYLAIVPCDGKTGLKTGTAVASVVKERKLEAKVAYLVFDTTASNTGEYEGAIVHIQHQLGRVCLCVACRRHLYECIIRAVYSELFAESKGPNIDVFVEFRDDIWINFTQEERQGYRACPDGLFNTPYLRQLRANAVQFFKFLLKHGGFREDYKECIILALIFLGHPPFFYKQASKREERYQIHAPGAVSKTRWMCLIIYLLKMALFAHLLERFHTPKSWKIFRKALFDMALWIVLIYLPTWLQTADFINAPLIDLYFGQTNESYAQINKVISEAALRAFKRHMWFLGELVCSLFYSDLVSVKEKNQMRQALIDHKAPVTFDPKTTKRQIKYKPTDDETFSDKTISYFINALDPDQRHIFFHSFGLSEEFLKTDASTWKKNPDYLAAQKMLLAVECTNERSERGCAMTTELNNQLTKDEDQRQGLYQIVAQNRTEMPSCNKKDLFPVNKI